MNIQESIEEVGYLLEMLDSPYESDQWEWSREVQIGELVLNIRSEIRYLYEFARTLASVPTEHDAQAEMDGWDEFFECRKEAANG